MAHEDFFYDAVTFTINSRKRGITDGYDFEGCTATSKARSSLSLDVQPSTSSPSVISLFLESTQTQTVDHYDQDHSGQYVPIDCWNDVLQSVLRRSTSDTSCDLRGISMSSFLYEGSEQTVGDFVSEVSNVCNKHPKMGYTVAYDVGVIY